MSLQARKAKQNKQVGPHQTKNCTTKETSAKQKDNLLNGRRYLQITYPMRG